VVTHARFRARVIPGLSSTVKFDKLLLEYVRFYVHKNYLRNVKINCIMKTATITDFRQRMKEHLDEIQEDQDILVLTGPKKKDFVILTLETFNAMEETAHLLSTSANTKRLMESIAQDRAGQATVREVSFGDSKPTVASRKKVAKGKSR
jgi:antitoxin YefM